MPTKQPAKPKLPEGFEDARSAKVRRGFTATHDGRRYLLAAGRRLRPDHPVVAAFPDKFAPSGEAVDTTAGGRDLTPKPKPVGQPTRVRYIAVCAGDPPCDWQVERDSEAAAVAVPHWHAPE